MSGVARLIANPPFLASFESAPEVRARTRPHRSYDPVRLPPGPPPESDGGDATSNRTGLPRLPVLPFQRAVPITPADRTGAGVDGLPVRAAFPKVAGGSASALVFRGLLRLHSRYGPPDRSRRPLSRGFGPASHPAEPLVSCRTHRHLSGWNLPPLATPAFGAHAHCHRNTVIPRCTTSDGRQGAGVAALSLPCPPLSHERGRYRFVGAILQLLARTVPSSCTHFCSGLLPIRYRLFWRRLRSSFHRRSPKGSSR